MKNNFNQNDKVMWVDGRNIRKVGIVKRISEHGNGVVMVCINFNGKNYWRPQNEVRKI